MQLDRLKRRQFILLLGATGIAAVGPLTTDAAEQKIWRVGLLSNSPPPSGMATSWRDEIVRVLAQNGFVAGRNLEMVERFSGGDAHRLPRLAREIYALEVDTIVAISSPSVRAVMGATQSIPVVMVVGEDPVELGMVASLAHPGGRVTGIAFRTPEGDAKRLELLRQAIPAGRHFGYLGMSYEIAPKAEEMARAAARLGIEVTTYWVNGPDEYAAAFARMRNEDVAGVVVGVTQPLATNASRVVAIAAENRLPTICEWGYMARVGCVLGFGHDLTYGQRRVGEYVARILKGTSPSELPVEESDAWKLTVNLRVAAQLGITLSPSILARADEVIE